MNKKIFIFLVIILYSIGIVTSANLSLGDTPSPTLQINENNTGQSQYNGPNSETIQWDFTSQYEIRSSPTIGENNTIYFTDGVFSGNDGNLYAVANNSTHLWNLSIGSTGNSVTIGSDGNLFIGTNNGTFYAISPNGVILDTFKALNKISSTAAIFNDTIYITSMSNDIGGVLKGTLYGLKFDGTSFTEVMNSIISNDELGYGLHSSKPAIDQEGNIYVSGGNGGVHAFNSDGSLKWTFTGNNTFYESSPTIAKDGTIYVVGSNVTEPPTLYSTFYALNRDGTIKWSLDIEKLNNDTRFIGRTGIVVANDDTIYFSTENGYIYAVLPNGIVK